jgi:hypothetical protein
VPQNLSEMGDMVGIILDSIPYPIFLVDKEVQIIGFNRSAFQMFAQEPERVMRRRPGEVLHCLHSTEVPQGCGWAEPCQDCPIRNSVGQSGRGRRVVRQRAKMELVAGDQVTEIYVLVTTGPLIYGDQSLVLLMLEDISELMELKKILPMCASCKRIRDDREYWTGVEKYFKENPDLDFSHSICPECAAKLYPEFFEGQPGEG